ncbi:MAG: glucosaminidase domain-containing protein [Proteobacteria bacterium]|uniref:glucosaminidase domain-containing protein n=1 Tax=Aquabacterium sp. TaxID=1872578 RepID=UPI0035C6D211|nr:glucosaminidase domain-containing protein [Pseudomonadota bacterium]
MLNADASGALAGLQRAVQSIEQGLERIAAPSLPAGGGAGKGNFSGLFQQVRQEVSDFLHHGSSDAVGLSSQLSSQLPSMRQPQAMGLVNGINGVNGISATEASGFPQEMGAERQQFVNAVSPLAEQAAAQLGVAPELLVAHAALESGWGQRPLRQADGRDTHNLFGIKAGSRWQGDSAQALTTEYAQGQPALQTERFRSYPDAASAFQDYAQLLRSPRYQGALGVGGDARAFAQGLVRGGYATDPAYADKFVRVAASLKVQPPTQAPASAQAAGALQSRAGRD